MFGCVSKVVGMFLTLRVVCAGSGSFSVSTNARMPLYNGLYSQCVPLSMRMAHSAIHIYNSAVTVRNCRGTPGAKHTIVVLYSVAVRVAAESICKL